MGIGAKAWEATKTKGAAAGKKINEMGPESTDTFLGDIVSIPHTAAQGVLIGDEGPATQLANVVTKASEHLDSTAAGFVESVKDPLYTFKFVPKILKAGANTANNLWDMKSHLAGAVLTVGENFALKTGETIQRIGNAVHTSVSTLLGWVPVAGPVVSGITATARGALNLAVEGLKLPVRVTKWAHGGLGSMHDAVYNKIKGVVGPNMFKQATTPASG